MPFQSLIGGLVNKWGSEVAWERATHCPYVSPRSQICAHRPVPNCPTCGGKGVLYDPPKVVSGILANPKVNVQLLGFGQNLPSMTTLLLSPKDDPEAQAMLAEGVMRLFPDRVELRDRFTLRNVLYVADGPATPPALANESIAWRVPVKRVDGSKGGG